MGCAKYYEWHQGPANWERIQSIHYAWPMCQVLEDATLLCITRRKLRLREGKEIVFWQTWHCIVTGMMKTAEGTQVESRGVEAQIQLF